MSASKFIRIALRVSESALLIALMLATLVIAYFPYGGISTPLITVWLIGELFSAAILAATFVESILACRYDLQAYGYLLFQGFKLLLWTAVTFAASGVLIQTSRTSRNQLGPLGLVYAITPLFLILVLFITGFIYAYTIYHEKENAQQDDENAPLLSGETAS